VPVRLPLRRHGLCRRYSEPGTIRLLDEPEKEGFRFGGWLLEINDEQYIFDAEAEFLLTTSLTFTAIWE